MKQSKHLLYIIFSIVFATAFGILTYQILPIYKVTLKTGLLIGFVALIGAGIGFAAVRLLKKQTKLPFKRIILIAIGALIPSVFILSVFDLSIMEKEFTLPMRTITIRSNSTDTDQMIIFNGLHNGIRGIGYASFEHSEDWVRSNQDLIFEGNDEATLSYSGQIGRNATLSFIKTSQSAAVNIDWGDGSSETLSLYDETNTPIQLNHAYSGTALTIQETLNTIINYFPIWFVIAIVCITLLI